MPNCPRDHRERIIGRVVTRKWRNCSLGKAVGICSHNYIRHRLTDYEALLKRHTLERNEARQIVKAELDEMFLSWQSLTPRKR
ncbi:MAG: DUF2293 domain-containing protein [Roseibium sp.]|uniref:DUF2293 domain-containing protein n=1 Tax=Roseibium sp. TaxID=1936156 RepID=UPI003D9C3458